MLWLLRKAFGVIALIWVLGWMFCLTSFFIDPHAAAAMFLVMIFASYVGVPAGIIWAILKTISVMGAQGMVQPVTVLGTYPSNRATRNEFLGLETPVPVREPPIRPTPTSSSPTGPDVYTYSAPGVPMCPTCGQRPAIFYCSTHQSAVCLECVAKHDDPEKCAYIPAFRAPKPK